MNLALNLSTGAAGDILRGGGVGAQSRGASAAEGNSPAAAVQVGTSGSDTLARTTQALQAVQAMQAAARAAARGVNNLGADPTHAGQQLPNVPNGLGLGGLQVAPGVPVDPAHPTGSEDPRLWQGASLPTQTMASGQTHVTVTQTAQQALLNWQTFNIGKDTRLTFDQTAGGANASQWIAFNKVNDPSGIPSQILGSLDAMGQVYIINANGIIFGGASQINLHSLVASALPINDNLIARGLLNNPDAQFLFSALPIPAGNNGTPAFTPPSSNTPDGHYGDVIVQKGAQISSPTTADHVGGRIALIGANVTNDGTISTPDGQTILAAGLQVGMEAHTTNDPSLRGLDVFVGQVGDYAGSAVNGGLIDAPRADVTLIGKEVDQFGFINSTTSVSLNGRIDLVASYNAISTHGAPNVPPFEPSATGAVNFGADSVTQIVPEYASSELVVGTELALRSQINVEGQNETLFAGATVFAPNALINFRAGTWVFLSNGTPTFLFSTGQIELDSGALIDASGSQDVSASVAENIVSAQLLGPELANSPLQRTGPLRGQTIQFDIRQTGIYNGRSWVGSPLADLSGYVNLVQRTVGELTTAGGTVALTAGSGVNLQSGATINVSGGSIDYAGAVLHTTQVVSGGKIFDISQATPDRVYDGVFTGGTQIHPKWGLVDTFTNPLPNPGHFEDGYVQGGSGGALSITAPQMELSANLVGKTVAGSQQRTSLPSSSSLSLAFQTQDPVTGNFFSPTPPSIFFESNAGLAPAGALVLSTSLFDSSGFGALKIDNSDGDVTLPAGVVLNPGAAGSITIAAANIDLEGAINAPGGTFSFTAYNFSPHGLTTQTPRIDPLRGHFVLGSDATLNTAGLLVDDRPLAAAPNSLPLAIKGGAVTINAFDTRLEAGSSIDVSGGVRIGSTGTIAYGNGGSISIAGGQDPAIASLTGGMLSMNANLAGFSGNIGGKLSLLAPLVQIGGASEHPDALFLSPEFFDAGGFTSFSVKGLGEIDPANPGGFLPGFLIASGTSINPRAQSWLAVPDANKNYSLVQTLLPQSSRTPASIALTATGVIDSFTNAVLVRGDLTMSSGSLILTDPGAAVSLAGGTVTVLGSIADASGSITIKGSDAPYFPAFNIPVPSVLIGADSVLSAAGTTLLTPNSLGLRTGSVLNGGSIAISGDIVAEHGAVLDVSGATDVLDLAPGYSGQTRGSGPNSAAFIPTRVDSNAGSITVAGGQELFNDATLLGRAGGDSASGGTLTVSSGVQGGAPNLPTDVTMMVTQSGSTLSGQFPAIGQPVLDQNGQAFTPRGYFAADSFNLGGFDSLVLKGTVQFAGLVELHANTGLTIGTSGVIYADAAVNLNASYVSLGQPFLPSMPAAQRPSPFQSGSDPFYVPPVHGSGTLNVNAGLIDIGNLSLQNIGTANLVATNGDIRGDGGFDVAGDINLTAGQIYPPTAVSFTIAAYDYLLNGVTQQGTITITGSGSRKLPLTAGGNLNVYGSQIVQNGTLRAPLGTINLGAGVIGATPIDPITNQNFASTQQLTLGSSSVTSVSAVDPVTGKPLVIPYGLNSNGTAWIDPLGTDITAGGLPAKAITISAANLADQPGSTVDISGGGDLYAYRFVPGAGGTVDILNSSSSFAIIPDFQANFAPYAPFNPNALGGNLAGDPGYANANLKVGSQIYLQASNGLPAGMYTLLPARYALLPGAFLVTPRSGVPSAPSSLQADGTSIVPGYQFNGLSSARTGSSLYSFFEVAPESVVRARAQYDDSFANTFLKAGALENNAVIPRLPVDAGQLVLAATHSLSIEGGVISKTPTGGLGSLVDISVPGDILIGGVGVAGARGELVLDASSLTSFGADSLLIGGYRQITASGTAINVIANSISLDNAGTPLQAPDVILVANQSLALAPGADVEAAGAISNAGTLLLHGNGTLLRVSSDPSAQISRTGTNTSQLVTLDIGAGAIVSGASLILDSSSVTTLDPTATLTGKSIFLNSGLISLQLADVGNPTDLVLSSDALSKLEVGAQSISLLSYSTIDIYGAGDVGGVDGHGAPILSSLALRAGEIRGFDLNGGSVNFFAQNLTIGNAAAAAGPGAVANSDGSVVFNANVIQLGANQTQFDQFASVIFNVPNGVLFQNSGSVSVSGALTINTPILTGNTGATESLIATGAVNIGSISGGLAKVNGGLGAQLTITGETVTDNSVIALSSGAVSLHATGGDISVGGSIDVGGTAQTFFDLTRYTNGGVVSLTADQGSVTLAQDGAINVAAQSGGGDAGFLSVKVPNGEFIVAGTLAGQGGANGKNGSFSLDALTLPTLGTLPDGVTMAPNLAPLTGTLFAAGFSQAQTIRLRSGTVLIDGAGTNRARANVFNLSADQGSIYVTGSIDGSGDTGGTITLSARGSLVLFSGSQLTVAGQSFNNAGKGGVISLAAGSEINGAIDPNAVLDIRSGSTIDLSVAANTATSAAMGDFTGTLHLRAPQTSGGTDLQMAPINGTISGASAIVVEGYRIFDASGDGSIDNQEANVFANGQLFGSNTPAMANRLLSDNQGLAPVLHVQPGAEIINLSSDLTLASSWDLSGYRFGPHADPTIPGSGEPGVLTLRAAGNLAFLFGASLSDGFDASQGFFGLWDARLLAPGSQSWAYNLVAGADFSATGILNVSPLGNFAQGQGSVLVGLGSAALPVTSVSSRADVILDFYQTIRTGTGDITIAAGRDIQMLNPLATIYTAGSQASSMAGFDLPQLDSPNPAVPAQDPLYPAQYSLDGGNVTLTAQNDIIHQVQRPQGLAADSTKELPTNWLYRRGALDPVTGNFALTSGEEVQSTSWWVDFSNFFQGVGALGGGNVVLSAGHNVSNVDAVAPTNARMPGRDGNGNPIAPRADSLLELGGGDVLVQAGVDIDGGAYYVERGHGELVAGNSIHTNQTRAALAQTASPGNIAVSSTWLPTTLFLGKGSFDVAARQDVLLGPVANVFLLPIGINNTSAERSYFTTYDAGDQVGVEALIGNVTLKDSSDNNSGSLSSWFQNVLLSFQNRSSYAAISQPWLRVGETRVSGFSTFATLMPPALSATAFSADINLVGRLTLVPSAVGSIDLLAAGSINGVQINGLNVSNGNKVWGSSLINLSDADPSRLPGITTPLASNVVLTPIALTTSVNNLFTETGSTAGNASLIQTKQALHAPGPLHLNDPNPVHLYARSGSFSGTTLFAGKSARVIAGFDITDVALYVQNNSSDDVSVVSAGRDIIAYDPNSTLRQQAQSNGNELLGLTGISTPASGNPTAGDIQIGGPGTLEVLAGRNLDLGVGPNNIDGTAIGLSSIGNGRNPSLPFAGASIIATAGVGGGNGLEQSLDFSTFITQFLDPGTSGGQSVRYLPQLGQFLGLTNPSNDQVWAAFNQLPKEQQSQLALDIFYLVLRDSGRDHNDPASPNFGNFDNGYAAIAALFPDSTKWQGDISLTSREIKTTNGGDINLLAPGGRLDVGLNAAGAQAADQGILTQFGGNINIFTEGDVNVGTSRIFTLRGGNEIIFSSKGSIAAGSSSKTVQAAPPTRVLVDPQSADVQTDLAGVATGGGIGALEEVAGVPPADIDLIAPVGTIDAGDAGIRVSGNLNLAALVVINAGNIQVGGSSTGVPTVAAPNLGSLTNASNTVAASSNAAQQLSGPNNAGPGPEDAPSIISVEVLGYGGDSPEDEEERRKKKKQPEQQRTAQAGRKSLGHFRETVMATAL